MYGNTNFMLALHSMVPELTGYLDPVIITSNVDTTREKIMTGISKFQISYCNACVDLVLFGKCI